MTRLLTLIIALLIACGGGNSVYRTHLTMLSSFDESGRVDSFGTGWFIATRGGYSIIATAGHLCDSHSFLLVESADGLETPGVPVHVDLDRSAGRDSCLVLVHSEAPRVIRAGTLPDEFGADVWYAGYPVGELAVFRGMFTGRKMDGKLVFSMPVAGGASGAPIIRGDRAVSMVVAVSADFSSVSMGIDSAQVLEMQTMADSFLELLDEDAP